MINWLCQYVCCAVIVFIWFIASDTFEISGENISKVDEILIYYVASLVWIILIPKLTIDSFKNGKEE